MSLHKCSLRDKGTNIEHIIDRLITDLLGNYFNFLINIFMYTFNGIQNIK